jgi:hypothetical protein
MMLLDLYPRNPKRFLSPPSSISYEDENESNEPDYNEDKDQLEEEQEEETEETSTVNQIF